VRARERNRLLTESVLHIAGMLEAAAAGPVEDLDRELLQLLVDALRQTARIGGAWPRAVLEPADFDQTLCSDPFCLHLGLHVISGRLWCRQHALDAACDACGGRRR